jgi:prepilin-type N-terminal cleavage/methylation domain-containing protein
MISFTAMAHDFAQYARRRKNIRGFTLMELLVVMSIFSTVVLMASDIFLMSDRAERKVFASERIQADARFTMEAIVREIRTGTLDYSYYSGRGTPIGTPDGELALIESDGTPIKFKVSDDTNANLCANAQSAPCLLVTVGANATPAAITPQDEAVRTVKFYISPTSDPNVFDPATGTYANDVQPHVTVVLVLESRDDRSGEQSVVYLQTTAENRSYLR